jgi:hypothetical protein
MAAPYLAASNADLDYLLARVARALQLTPDQHALAVQHYEAVARWLAASGSPLAPFNPWIYPQGSMALETTVRPRTREEYDLDLVCQMLATGMTALELYNAVYARLRENNTYAPMLEKKNRCLRLNYAHNFHLDIIPAEPDRVRGGTAIIVPDRSLRHWTASNPHGYVAWFTDRSRVTLAELRKKIDPIPHPTPSDEKPALTIAVQLMKRRRDMLCDEETAPRSIVLTTLAGEYYHGTDCVLTAMMQIVAGIQQRIRDGHPGRITVCNPTNAGEKFCESFEGAGRYAAFKWFINQVEQDLAGIAAAQGIPELQRVLANVFGGEPVSKAVRSYGELLKAQRDDRTLRFSGAGIGALSIVSPPPGIARDVPPNRYFGGERGQ